MGLGLGALLLTVDARAAPPAGHEVLGLLTAQADAWNRGDLQGFLVYYDDSPDTVFVSGANVERGFAPIRARYQKRYGTSRETMGTLSFTDARVVAASAEVVVVSGAWLVELADKKPSGRFTLVWKKQGTQWRITYDHTSVAAP